MFEYNDWHVSLFIPRLKTINNSSLNSSDHKLTQPLINLPMALTLWLVSRIQLCGILTDVLLQAVVDPLDNGLLVLTLASQKTWNASSEIITACNFRNDLHDICSKQKSQKTAYTCTNSSRQWTANRVKLQHWHVGRLARSRPEPPKSFIAGNEASVQQQQPQNAPRARCILVHHGNIEIHSNDSPFFLRKNRESKTHSCMEFRAEEKVKKSAMLHVELCTEMSNIVKEVLACV